MTGTATRTGSTTSGTASTTTATQIISARASSARTGVRASSAVSHTARGHTPSPFYRIAGFTTSTNGPVVSQTTRGKNITNPTKEIIATTTSGTNAPIVSGTTGRERHTGATSKIITGLTVSANIAIRTSLAVSGSAGVFDTTNTKTAVLTAGVLEVQDGAAHVQVVTASGTTRRTRPPEPVGTLISEPTRIITVPRVQTLKVITGLEKSTGPARASAITAIPPI